MSIGALRFPSVFVGAGRAQSLVAFRCTWFLLPLLAAAGVGRGQDVPKRAVGKDEKHIVRIVGAVRDSADRPVADATVWLVEFNAARAASSELMSETRCDAEGAFSFYEVVEQGDAPHLIARDSQGRLGWSASAVRPDPNVIRLREVGDCRGRVVDAQGQPIAGARVAPQAFFCPAPGERSTTDFVALFSKLTATFETRTAADGGFVLQRVPKDARVRCEVSAPGFGKPQASFETSHPATIKLDRAGRISGILSPLEGGEAAKGGYKLQLSRQRPEQESETAEAVSLSYFETLTTDDDGAFRSGDLPPGQYVIAAVGGQGRTFFADATPDLELKPGQTLTGVSVPIAPTVLFSGRVIDHESGKPVAKARLHVYQSRAAPGPRQPVDSQEVTTDAEGRFEARLPPNNTTYRVLNVPREFLVPQLDSRNRSSHYLAGGDEQPTIELARAARVEGLVVDEAGQPAPHAQLHIDLRRESSRPYDWLPSFCDRDGKFAIDQVDPEAKFSVRARALDAVTDGMTAVTVSELKGPVKLVVAEKNVYRIRGTVLDDKGRPVPEATVSLQWNREVHTGQPAPVLRGRAAGGFGVRGRDVIGVRGGFRGGPAFGGRAAFPLGPVAGAHQHSQLEQLAIDADGHFESKALWPRDTYRVSVVAPGYARLDTPYVQGAAGAMHDFGRLLLKRNDLVVSGIVVDESGQPVAGAELQIVMPPRSSKPPLRSDAQGRFSITDVHSALPLALRARTENKATQGAAVILPADFGRPVKLVIAENHAFRLRGAVLDRRGNPAPGASVSVVWNRRGTERNMWLQDGRRMIPGGGPVTLDLLVAAADGSFETPALWPDENYHLVAAAPGFVSKESAVTYGPAGESKAIEPLVLTRNDLKIEGRVVDSAGRPLEAATVLNSGDAGQRLVSTAGGDGRFSLEGFYDGPVYLLARSSGRRAVGWRGEAGGGPIEIVFPGADKPPAQVAVAEIDAAAQFADERKLARRWISSLWELRDRFDDNPRAGAPTPFRATSRGGRITLPYTVERLAQLMARLDLDQALTWSVSEGGGLDESVRSAAVEGNPEVDVERALELLEGYTSSAARGALLARAHRELDGGKPANAMRLLEAAMAAVTSAESVNPQGQALEWAISQAHIGALAIRAGAARWGGEQLLQAVEKAEKAAGGAAAIDGQVAAELAATAPLRALRLLQAIQRTPGFASDYSYAGRAAAVAAANESNRAREFLALVAPGAASDRAKMQVASQLARRDFDTAIEFVDEISQASLWIKADALCWLAVAVAQQDPEQACALIDRALELYLDAPPTYLGVVEGGRPVEAARIALAARAIGYPNLPSVIDRVLALRLTAAEEPPERRIASTVNVARLLALVDPATARELLISIEPHVRLLSDDDGSAARGGLAPRGGRGRRTSNGATNIGRGEWLQAWALVDLQEAERRCDEELANLKQQSNIETTNIGLLPLAELLVIPPGERERYMLRSIDPRYWFPGDDAP